MIQDIDRNDNINIKLIDFGFAKELKERQLFVRQLGSDHYLSPEVVKGEPYDEKVDIWSATVCVYIMLNEYLPFYGKGS